MSIAPEFAVAGTELWLPFRANYHDLAGDTEWTFVQDLANRVLVLEGIDIAVAGILVIGGVAVSVGSSTDQTVIWQDEFQPPSPIQYGSWRGWCPLAGSEEFHVQNGLSTSIDAVLWGKVYPVVPVITNQP
jgi:hypothetical protein